MSSPPQIHKLHMQYVLTAPDAQITHAVCLHIPRCTNYACNMSSLSQVDKLHMQYVLTAPDAQSTRAISPHRPSCTNYTCNMSSLSQMHKLHMQYVLTFPDAHNTHALYTNFPRFHMQYGQVGAYGYLQTTDTKANKASSYCRLLVLFVLYAIATETYLLYIQVHINTHCRIIQIKMR